MIRGQKRPGQHADQRHHRRGEHSTTAKKKTGPDYRGQVEDSLERVPGDAHFGHHVREELGIAYGFTVVEDSEEQERDQYEPESRPFQCLR